LLAAAALDVASAAYGFHAARSCRAAEAERGAAIARLRLLPPPYGVPPFGEPPPFWPPPAAALTAPPPSTPAPSE
jgi:hypothetical protein